ncbi:hypothetical protein [Terribacillus aidingensis]|nr:hypothetical protein [Terribacillus aidingensis]
MGKHIFLHLVGTFILIGGIYLSLTNTFIGVGMAMAGAILLGASSYFVSIKKTKQPKP